MLSREFRSPDLGFPAPSLFCPSAVTAPCQGHGTTPGCEKSGNFLEFPGKGIPRLLLSLWKAKEREGGAQMEPTKPGAQLWVGCDPPPRNNLGEHRSRCRDFLNSRWNFGEGAAGRDRCPADVEALGLLGSPGSPAGRRQLRRSSLSSLSLLRYSHFSSRNVQFCRDSARNSAAPTASSPSPLQQRILPIPKRFSNNSSEPDLFINKSAALLEG